MQFEQGVKECENVELMLDLYRNLLTKYGSNRRRHTDSSVGTSRTSTQTTHRTESRLKDYPVKKEAVKSYRPSRRTSSHRSPIVRSKPWNGTLPAISVMRIDGNGGEGIRDCSRLLRRLEFACGLIHKAFHSMEPLVIWSFFSELRTRNEELSKRKESLIDSLTTLRDRRSKLLDELSQKKKILFDARAIHSHCKFWIEAESKEAKGLKDERNRVERGIEDTMKLLNIPPNGLDSVIRLRQISEELNRGSEYIVKRRRARSHTVVNVTPSTTRSPSRLQFGMADDSSPLADVPCLPLDSIGNSGEFRPGTRSNRRAFPEASLPVHIVESDMSGTGRLLGNILIERFLPVLQSYKEAVSTERREVKVPRIPFRSTRDIYRAIFEAYSEKSASLSLSLFDVGEIGEMDASFLKFLSVRNACMDQLKASTFASLLFLDEMQKLCDKNVLAFFWIIRDIVQMIVHHDDLSTMLQKLAPLVASELSKLRIIKDVAKTSSYIGLIACLAAFIERDPDYFVEVVDSVIQSQFDTIIGLWKSRWDGPISRDGFLALFCLGKHVPNKFPLLLSMTNACTSICLEYIDIYMKLPSCVRAATEFFNSAFRYMDQEGILWHTAVFFHHVARQLSQKVIEPSTAINLISSLTAIVANRQHFTIGHLNNLYFIQYLIKHFELEVFLASKPDVQPAKREMPMRMSYLDIPTLSQRLEIPALNLDNPKLQLHFRPQPQHDRRVSISITNGQYVAQRSQYPLYVSDEVHVAMIQLFFATLIDHSLHRLDTNFCDPFPTVNRKPNVLFTLMQHMEAVLNNRVVESLERAFTPHPSLMSSQGLSKECKNARSQKPNKGMDLRRFFTLPIFISLRRDEEDDLRASQGWGRNEEARHFEDYLRLLRLTYPGLFQPERYSNGDHIASGAFGAVMGVARGSETFAVKVLQKSRTEFDSPHLMEIYTEVSILEICKGDRRVTQLKDYGCTVDSYYIVMEFYPMTLKTWRKREKDPQIGVILRLYREFLHCATVLTDRRINHFDIKCDNVMLDANGMPGLADFGESMSYKNDSDCYTLLNKGTEWIKAPEMLSIALNSAANPNYDRRRKAGAGPASDIWSVGCLFFELITGEYLFVDSDWSRFFLRITDPNERLLTDGNIAQLPKEERFPDFLIFVLERNVRRRPDLQQVIRKFDEMFPEACRFPLPKLDVPVFT